MSARSHLLAARSGVFANASVWERAEGVWGAARLRTRCAPQLMAQGGLYSRMWAAQQAEEEAKAQSGGPPGAAAPVNGAAAHLSAAAAAVGTA